MAVMVTTGAIVYATAMLLAFRRPSNEIRDVFAVRRHTSDLGKPRHPADPVQ